MSVRRIAREVVLQSLFQIDFTEAAADAALCAAMAEREEENTPKAESYAKALLAGVQVYKEEIDAKLNAVAVDWSVERMPATDRNILRIAVYEMLFAEPAIDTGIAINEAVEIAKVYGTDDSPKFINGVLGKLAKE